MDINPGPFNPIVLWDQENHVSSDLWKNIDRGVLEICQMSAKLNEWNLTKQQEFLLEQLGFGIFCHQAVVSIHNASLLSALVERWRSETNSFHLNCGETSITLEDVGFLFGLPILGKPLTCGELEYPKNYFVKVFGQQDAVDDWEQCYKRGGISLTWLRHRYGHLPEDATPDDVVKHTKAYLLYLCGAILFPTKSKNIVHPRYLLLLERLEEIVTYAWGAAVLGHLYRGLHDATRKTSTKFAGCATLLLMWAHERFNIGCPTPKLKSQKLIPRALSWAYSSFDPNSKYYQRRKNPHHHLVFYRGEFDNMLETDGVWRPYQSFDRRLSWDFFEVRLAGAARIPLIHYDIVEFQMPDRFMRQFGYLQSYPSNAENMVELRVENKLFEKINYEKHRGSYIRLWEAYMETLEGQVLEVLQYISIEDYMRWYREITRRRIHHPPACKVQVVDYESRAFIDQYVAVNCLESANYIFEKMFTIEQPPEFRTMYQTWFNTLYQPLMSNYKGVPINPNPSQPIFGQMKIDMTGSQPSVQESQPVVGPSIRQGTKLPIKKKIEGTKHSHFLKELKIEKITWLNIHWFSPTFNPSDFPHIHPHGLYELQFKDVNSLRPTGWLRLNVLDAYLVLLRDREANMWAEGIERWALFYFMPTYFAELATEHLPSGGSIKASTLKFLRSYINPEVGSPIHECDYIFIPVVNESNSHFILFVWSVKKWKILLLDPLFDDKPAMPLSQLYHKYFKVVVDVIPIIFREANPKGKWPKSKPKVKVCVNRPTQWNSDDCGIYVAKYIDFFLHRININKEPRWSANDANVFRLRIAHEIRMCKARKIPQAYLFNDQTIESD